PMEAPDPGLVAHAGREHAAGCPMRGDFEHGAVDGEAVAYSDIAALDAGKGEILAENTGRKGLAQLAGPPVIVIGEIDIDRLVDAAMVAPVDDGVADK